MECRNDKKRRQQQALRNAPYHRLTAYLPRSAKLNAWKLPSRSSCDQGFPVEEMSCAAPGRSRAFRERPVSRLRGGHIDEHQAVVFREFEQGPPAQAW